MTTLERIITTDSDVDEIDDELSDDELIDDTIYVHPSGFPDECYDEKMGIELLSKYFIHHYNACPMFLMKSLQVACQEAFSPILIKERRPVLVYIHNCNSMFNNIFCQKIFTSSTIIDYLLANYIVWPWDITLESNRNILVNIWKNMFPEDLVEDFSCEQCPMLIGIMRLSVEETNGSLISDYQFKTLLKCDTLIRTQERSTLETVFNELANFKEECDSNEQALSFDFITETGLCWDVILEITKYLSLNDIISAFSCNILRVLHTNKAKILISNPSDSFNKMILRKINIDQISSLQLDASLSWSSIEMSSLNIFCKVTKLILFNLELTTNINIYEKYFPQLNCLSLWYDNEISFNLLNNILGHFRILIKRFEVHCAGAFCTHYYEELLNQQYIRYHTIEYFLLDVGHFPLTSMNECLQQKTLCFLIRFIDFIKSLQNIRYVHLITNKYNLEKLLDVNQWKNLANVCSQLKKVTLQVLGSMPEDKQLLKKIMYIQNELYKIRQTIKFQVIFM